MAATSESPRGRRSRTCRRRGQHERELPPRRHGAVIKDHGRIFRRYLFGWAAIDLFSSIPINHILCAVGSGLNLGAASRLTKLARLFKFSRMLKVFKVLKVASSLNEWDDDPTIVVLKDMKRFGSLITGVFFMAHYAACAFSLAAMGNEKGWNAKTWVAHYYNDGYAMKHDELGSDWATSWEADDGLKPLERHSHHTRAFPTPMRVYCVRAPRAVFVLLC